MVVFLTVPARVGFVVTSFSLVAVADLSVAALIAAVAAFLVAAAARPRTVLGLAVAAFFTTVPVLVVVVLEVAL